MVRVGISVEGETEERFFKSLLIPYLAKSDIFVSPINLGGNISINRVEKELKKLAHSFDYVSTFYDFYGFKGKSPNETKASLELRIYEAIIEEEIKRKIFPYIQMHEFEGLLFSSPDAIAYELQDKSLVSWASQILQKFENQPEKINDSAETAPSRRLGKFNYRKTTHGPNIAQLIGLENIRAMCPGFNEWMTHLERLNQL